MRKKQFIIGIDEAGRGPLAGPVCVGAVLVKKDFDFSIFPHLNDSKKMTKKRRDVVYNELDSMCKSNSSIQFSTGFASANDIDKYGIQQAISVSINNGLKNLEITPAEVTIFLDGGLKAPQIYKQKTVIGGDGLLQVISLASVVAKVSRDRKMLQFDQKYPLFNFAQHKGYGTKDHREAIGKYGLSPIHRKSYTQNIITP